jgi:hypothetical protein
VRDGTVVLTDASRLCGPQNYTAGAGTPRPPTPAITARAPVCVLTDSVKGSVLARWMRCGSCGRSCPTMAAPGLGSSPVDTGVTMTDHSNPVRGRRIVDVLASQIADPDPTAEPEEEYDSCPVCGKLSSYSRSDDRYLHLDGTDNRACWAHISRGMPTPENPGEPALAKKLLCRDDLNNLPDPQPLIEGVLDQGTNALLYGPWGSGKSFISLDWGLSVATARSWQGRPTEEKYVLYVAGEGAFGYKARVDAWEQGWHTEVKDGGNIFEILPKPVNLMNRFEVNELAALIRWGGYGFIIFDTLARCMVGADENSAKDCGIVVDVLTQLRECTPDGRGVVLGVHHTGKDGRTFRGSSAFEAGADTVYSVTKDAGWITLNREKRKDGPPNDHHDFKLDSVDGTGSCVISVHRGVDKSERATRILSTFVHHFSQTGASKAELRKVSDMPDATFYRAVSDLLQSGELVNEGTAKRPFYRAAAQ